MPGNTSLTGNKLLGLGLTWLRDRLPQTWTIQESDTPIEGVKSVQLSSEGSQSTLLVAARSVFGPRDVERLLGTLTRLRRESSRDLPVLVLAPWLSLRTQQLLRVQGINYLDLTGNALISLDSPALYIETRGAVRNPNPLPEGRSRLTGPKASRILRTLIDVSPPYGVREVAQAIGLTPGYISRVFEALDHEALIERNDRGAVETVDIDGIFRRWAENYDVFKTNQPTTFLAPRGATSALQELTNIPSVAVTGSFSAVRISPIVAPASLVFYCDEPETIADKLNLLPADTGANVVILKPFDQIIWQRTTVDEQIQYVSPSQTAIDCLTGNGRMPAEGQAVIDWMLANQTEWRLHSITEL